VIAAVVWLEIVHLATDANFHEIRALGAWLYEQQNFPQEYIQALLGHADEKMTRHYQEGHGNKTIEYVEVGAELAF
jgi:integrase